MPRGANNKKKDVLRPQDQTKTESAIPKTPLGRVLKAQKNIFFQNEDGRATPSAGKGSSQDVSLAGARAIACFVQWARCFLIARFLFDAWAPLRGRKCQFG